jgi:hypothetical protein
MEATVGDSTLSDPLGRTIVLHEHTWFGHIVKGHPDVRTYRALAEQAISNPLEIRFSSSDPNCRLYYGVGPSLRIMMVVVADVVSGIVKTAYRANKMKGTTEWLR